MLLALRKHLWRFPILAWVCVVLTVGLYALTTSFRHIAVGALNPNKNAFVTYIYNNRDDYPLSQMQVRDSASGEVTSLLPAVTPGLSGYDARWSVDGSRLVGLMETPEGRQQILEFQVAPPKLLRQEPVTGRKLEAVFWNPRGRLIHVEDDKEADSPSLRIVEENGAELATIEYGRGEEAFALASTDGEVLTVLVHPETQGTAKSDCVVTDGAQSAMLRFDTTTGRELSRLMATDFRIVDRSSTHVGIPDPPTVMFNIVKIGNESQAIARIGPRVGPVLLDDGSFATFRWKGETVTVISPESNEEREYQTGQLDQLVPSGDGNALLVTHQGRLAKLDLTSGQTRELLNVRIWLDLSRAVAVIGIPLFVILWLTLAAKAGHGFPMIEVGLVIVISIVVLMAWSEAASHSNQVHEVLRSLIYTALGAALPLLLVWVSTLDSIWGKTVPLGILGIAFLIAIIRAWANEYELFDFVLGGALLIFWQMLGIAWFRVRFGNLKRAQADNRTGSNSSYQLTLMQIIVTTATLAVLFTCLRIGGWSKLKFTSLEIIWMVTYTLLYSCSVLFSLWAAFHAKNIWFGLAMLLAVTVPLLVLHCGAALHLRLYLGGTTVEWYRQVFVASLITFSAWRYCRAQGYGLAKPPIRERAVSTTEQACRV